MNKNSVLWTKPKIGCRGNFTRGIEKPMSEYSFTPTVLPIVCVSRLRNDLYCVEWALNSTPTKSTNCENVAKIGPVVGAR